MLPKCPECGYVEPVNAVKTQRFGRHKAVPAKNMLVCPNCYAVFLDVPHVAEECDTPAIVEASHERKR